jgi:hypothetical protein
MDDEGPCQDPQTRTSEDLRVSSQAPEGLVDQMINFAMVADLGQETKAVDRHHLHQIQTLRLCQTSERSAPWNRAFGHVPVEIV